MKTDRSIKGFGEFKGFLRRNAFSILYLGIPRGGCDIRSHVPSRSRGEFPKTAVTSNYPVDTTWYDAWSPYGPHGLSANIPNVALLRYLGCPSD